MVLLDHFANKSNTLSLSLSPSLALQFPLWVSTSPDPGFQDTAINGTLLVLFYKLFSIYRERVTSAHFGAYLHTFWCTFTGLNNAVAYWNWQIWCMYYMTNTFHQMSRAMRYHYGSEKAGRKGHLAMVKEKRLVYRWDNLSGRQRRYDFRDWVYFCHGCYPWVD